MVSVLWIYIIASIVVLICLFVTFIAAGARNKDVGLTGVGIIGFSLFLVLSILSIQELQKPDAIEVYQGKTTLEYTVKDGVKTDSVVVYKKKLYGRLE